MSFKESLVGGKFPIALEIIPPKTPNPDLLFRRATNLNGLTSAVDVVQRAQRQPSIEAALDLRQRGIDTIWNLTSGNLGLLEVKKLLGQAQEQGLNQVLIVQGDKSKKGVSAVNAIAIAQEFGAFTGAAFNPYAPDKNRELALARAKGPHFFLTQAILNYDRALPQIEKLQDVTGLPVVAMVMPLESPEVATLVSRRLGIYLPQSAIMSCTPETCWDRFTQLVGNLQESSNGIMIMTYNPDSNPETGVQITKSLKSAGIT